MGPKEEEEEEELMKVPAYFRRPLSGKNLFFVLFFLLSVTNFSANSFF
jgi:hypothetical protein